MEYVKCTSYCYNKKFFHVRVESKNLPITTCVCILRGYAVLNNYFVLIMCRRLCSEHIKLSTGCTHLSGTENLIRQLLKFIRTSKKADI